MAERMALEGRVAVVTGAGNGIGRGITLALASRGCDLALADIDPDGLDRTAEIVGSDVQVSTHLLDVGDAEAVNDLPAQVGKHHAAVNLLFNNAGVALSGSFEEVSSEEFEWLFDINFWGAVRTTRAFLPALKQAGDSRVVNISSVFGLVGPARQVPYAASKFAVRGFSESLRHELADTGVGVTVVHPGGIRTSIARSARQAAGTTSGAVERERAAAERHLRMPPERAGEIIVRGVERRKPRILVGWDAHIIGWLTRLVPVQYWKILGPWIGY